MFSSIFAGNQMPAYCCLRQQFVGPAHASSSQQQCCRSSAVCWTAGDRLSPTLTDCVDVMIVGRHQSIFSSLFWGRVAGR